MFSLYQKSTIIIFLLKCNIKLLFLDLNSQLLLSKKYLNIAANAWRLVSRKKSTSISYK